MHCVNLGCGSRYHPSWVNVDIAPMEPGIIAHDLSKNLPFPASGFDVVYHSHVLEHLRRSEALSFMRECFRVLKPGGILRVAVPDLERLCRTYLEKLDEVFTMEDSCLHDYEWMTIELLDQMVREPGRSEMEAFLSRKPLPNETFIQERIGEEGRRIIETYRHDGNRPARKPWSSRRSWSMRLTRLPKHFLTLYQRLIAHLLLGEQGRHALEIGQMRLDGSVHHWMYDRCSLGQLMRQAGFQDSIVQTATGSLVPQWPDYHLDTNVDGQVNKPDSLFMEAVKPHGA